MRHRRYLVGNHLSLPEPRCQVLAYLDPLHGRWRVPDLVRQRSVPRVARSDPERLEDARRHGNGFFGVHRMRALDLLGLSVLRSLFEIGLLPGLPDDQRPHVAKPRRQRAVDEHAVNRFPDMREVTLTVEDFSCPGLDDVAFDAVADLLSVHRPHESAFAPWRVEAIRPLVASLPDRGADDRRQRGRCHRGRRRPQRRSLRLLASLSEPPIASEPESEAVAEALLEARSRWIVREHATGRSPPEATVRLHGLQPHRVTHLGVADLVGARDALLGWGGRGL